MTLTGPGKNSFPVMADIIDEIDREHPSEAEVGAVIRAGSAYAVREPSRIVIEKVRDTYAYLAEIVPEKPLADIQVAQERHVVEP